MTVDELIAYLQALPADVRALPAYANDPDYGELWPISRANAPQVLISADGRKCLAIEGDLQG